MLRIRDLGIYQSQLKTGPNNAITDIEGVSVGHSTVIEGEGNWLGQSSKRQGSKDEGSNGPNSNGPYRTGVTVILPHQDNLYEDKVSAAVYTVNGFGKYAGLEQIRELGSIETPIALTSTLNMPKVADALITYAIEKSPHIGVGFKETGYQGYASVNPVVGECADGFLSDAQSRRVGEAEVREALKNASFDTVAEGSVGAGTGMSCFEWKGGIGTASRVLPAEQGGFKVGVLVNTNFGRPPELTISGVPVGQHIVPPNYSGQNDFGSIMMIVATNAPMDSRQLNRLAKRASFGLARAGSTCHAGSGDVVIAFSTTYRIPDRPTSILMNRPTLANEHEVLSTMSQAVIESIEESIYNSMFMSQTVVGRDGNTRYGIPVDEVVALVKSYSKRI